MGTNNFYKSDLYDLHHIIQSSMISYPKEIIIATLKDFFSKDSYYRFVKDEWGFSKTVDMTDVPLDAGINDNVTTRLYIGENYRYDTIFYPAILVKSGGSKYVPVSMNRQKGTVRYEDVVYDDGYGYKKFVKRPVAFVTAGAWEGSINIDIYSRGLRDRDELADLVSLCFTEIYFEELVDVGLVVKPISVSGATEVDDRADKLFRQTITLDVRSEWRREIPIKNTIDSILFAVYFQNIKNDGPIAQNLTINTELLLQNILK